jgi:hypothetical protein
MARVRITIEYDLEAEGNTHQEQLQNERDDWYDGNVTFEDVAALEPETTIKFEVIQ